MAGAALQACRQDRREVGEQFDEVIDLLLHLGEQAAEAGDDGAVALCDEALDLLDRSLDEEGLPGPTTAGAIDAVMAGPLARARQRLAGGPALALVR